MNTLQVNAPSVTLTTSSTYKGKNYATSCLQKIYACSRPNGQENATQPKSLRHTDALILNYNLFLTDSKN